MTAGAGAFAAPFAALAALTIVPTLAGSAAAAEAPPAYPQGAARFQTNCAVCHGATGAGLPSLAPPLRWDIVVEGKHYAFRMPDFGQLDDANLAAVREHRNSVAPGEP